MPSDFEGFIDYEKIKEKIKAIIDARDFKVVVIDSDGNIVGDIPLSALRDALKGANNKDFSTLEADVEGIKTKVNEALPSIKSTLSDSLPYYNIFLGFENYDENSGIPLGWSSFGTGTFEIDTNTTKYGSRSLKVSGTDVGGGWVNHEIAPIVQPGQRLIIGAWVKTDSVDGEAKINILPLTKKKDNLHDYMDSVSISGTNDWTLLTKEYIVPDRDVQYVKVELKLEGNGTVWFANPFCLSRFLPPVMTIPLFKTDLSDAGWSAILKDQVIHYYKSKTLLMRAETNDAYAELWLSPDYGGTLYKLNSWTISAGSQVVYRFEEDVGEFGQISLYAKNATAGNTSTFKAYLILRR